jgi:predicted NUDIX family NTP pyrophosphohydrolase
LKTSAGLLVYRRHPHLQVLLVHPGGPFWTKKDLGAWSIPKGEVEAGEDLLHRARLEFHEETGWSIEGPFAALAPARQTNKIVHAWAAQGDFDVSTLRSNTFEIEYPPRSGRARTFPEVDRAEWFELGDAREKILSGQRSLLNELEKLLKGAQSRNM